MEAELDRIGYDLKPFDIVLVLTGASRSFRQPDYERVHPGLRRASTEFLVDRLPRPFGFTVCAFPFKLGRASAAWTRVVAIFEDVEEDP